MRGELAERAREAVYALAAELEGLPLESLQHGPGAASLSGGAPGLALLFGYLSREPGADPHWAERTEACLDEAARILATAPIRAGLFSGFTGIAWVSQHLDQDTGDADEIDQALLEMLAHPTWKGHFDLVTGLVGLGAYALERLPRGAAVRGLMAVVGHLERLATTGDEGVRWHTLPELLPEHQRSANPGGLLDLGVAHGTPGVISLLADACRVEPCARRARPLLEGAVRWLLAVPRPGVLGSTFGKWMSPEGEAHAAPRLGWCYGDPGIAAVLLHAGRAAGEPAWERAALEIAAHAARAPLEESGIADAALCHGAVGLAHLFNRIFQATGDELFAESARLWYARGLDLRRPGEGIAGWPEDPGLLTGAAGIGLGLLAAVSTVEPEWDRLLRVAIPPR